LVNATYDYESLETTLVFIDITRIRKLENIRKDFIANLSHELRTPVAVIRANSESLVDGALDDKEIAQKFSNAILKNSEKLSYLLEDILNLSTIESGEYNLELTENSISEIFKTSINSVLSNNPDVKIINNISSDIKVICDIKALVQVIDNLIENSVKYGITEESNEIIINMKDQGSKVRFEIEDHGQGISADQRERVFERFFRIQNNNTSVKEGTGLGLSIVKNLVNLMGGSVGNEKAYPEGTIFWFTLNKKN
jgi:two-component system phosphate regulon sensor histidine kinase PhoR